jgi:hypothetical protein
MYRSTALSRRIALGLTSIAAALQLVACADPSAPARVPSANAIIIIGGRPMVFNALLRSIGNPDEESPTAVSGHLQLKVYETDDGLVASWMAVLINPDCEGATSLGGGIYLIQDSEDFPSPEDEPVLDLFPPQTTLGCGENVLQGVVPITEGLVLRLVYTPERFPAVFFLEGGGALTGTLQLVGPDAGTQ